MKTQRETAIEQMNTLGSSRTPFLFIIDYEMNECDVIPLSELKPEEIKYNFESQTNTPLTENYSGEFHLNKKPISYTEYLAAFSEVVQNLRYGNSYLLNLTFPTGIETNLSLQEIYSYSRAKFKLLYRNRFVVFSPEPFVRIRGKKIYSYPMKGTIDESIPNAVNLILQNKKESAEHATIVDLIRNDLSMVAEKVRVEEYRYTEKITTNSGNLLQISSRISGELPENYHRNIGSLLFRLLPAGSVTGAPKEKTVEIIRDVENYNRGFYTGVMGIFNGSELISSVLIRFIEQTDNGLIYKSGGGITIHSDPREEYEEMIKKVYVPLI